MNKRICLNKSVLDFINSKLTPESRVLEFGGGWSSKWLAHRCGELIVIETSFKWANIIKNESPGKCKILVPRVGLYYAKDLHKMLHGVTWADLVLIDCVEVLRATATRFAWPLVKPGGWLVFDDAQRERHESTIAWLNEVGGEPVSLVWQLGDVEGAEERLALVWQKNNSK